MSRSMASSLRRPLAAATVGIAAALVLAGVAFAQPTPVGGTVDNAPQEVTLPADGQPAFSFKNMTGVEICDFVIGVKTGAGQLTGALLDDPNNNTEDWDVDDDQSEEIDGGEGSAAPGAEGAGPAALGHPDNTQAAGRQIRIQEDGWNPCIRINGNFGITLTIAPPPAAGDKITIQPTNDVGANIYACKDGAKGKDESMTLNPRTHLNTKFATACDVIESVVTTMTLLIDSPGVFFEWLKTEPESAIAYEYDPDGKLMSATMHFEQPLEPGKSVLVQGELSDFGTVTLSGQPRGDAVDDIDPLDLGKDRP